MSKLLDKTLKIAGRLYESLIPDDETIRELSKKYAEMYYIEHDKRR